VLFRVRGAEALSFLFPRTPLQGTLVTPYDHPPIFCNSIPSRFALFIACFHGILCEHQTLGCEPIDNTIALEDVAYHFVGVLHLRGFLQLGICLLGALARMAQ
jgi:hypothetical protein